MLVGRGAKRHTVVLLAKQVLCDELTVLQKGAEPFGAFDNINHERRA